MAGRTGVTAATAALLVMADGALLLLRSARLLLSGAAWMRPRAIRLGLGASVMLLRSLLRRPALALGAGALMLPSAITVLAAAMPLLAIAGLSLILLAVLLLRLWLRRIGALARRTLAVLARPVAAFPPVASPLRTPVMRPSGARIFGALEIGLRPAEAPDFLEFGFGAFALRGFGLSCCLRVRRRLLRFWSGIQALPSAFAFAAGSFGLRWRSFRANLA